MNYNKILLFGVLGWLIMFAVVSAVLPLYTQYFVAKVIIAIVSGVIAFMLARYVEYKGVVQAFIVGILWIMVGIVLDAIITMRFNSLIFTMWSLWLGYALVLIAPLVRLIIMRPRLPETPETQNPVQQQ